MQTNSEICVEVEKVTVSPLQHNFYFLATYLLKTHSNVQNCNEYLAV